MEYDKVNRIANLTTLASPLTHEDIFEAIEHFDAVNDPIEEHFYLEAETFKASKK